MNHKTLIILGLTTVGLSLILKSVCRAAWNYYPARGCVKPIAIAWQIVILSSATLSLINPRFDVAFFGAFFGFLIIAQIRSIYLYRVRRTLDTSTDVHPS